MVVIEFPWPSQVVKAASIAGETPHTASLDTIGLLVCLAGTKCKPQYKIPVLVSTAAADATVVCTVLCLFQPLLCKLEFNMQSSCVQEPLQAADLYVVWRSFYIMSHS